MPLHRFTHAARNARRRRCAHRLADERGQAAVELVLVLPVLLVILIGIFDFGRALNYWNDANQIAGEGARFAAVNKVPTGYVSLKTYLKDQAMPELKGGGRADPVLVCITTPGGATVGAPVRVTLTSKLSLVPFLSDVLDVGQVSIKGDAYMRLEAVPSTIDTGCA